MRALLVGGQVAAVIVLALLVAERLEALLQVALECLIELLRLELQRLVVGVLATADHALAQRELGVVGALPAYSQFVFNPTGLTEVVG